jgi:hypothetical protein
MKPAYTDRPAAWDQAARIYQTPAEYATAFHGDTSEPRMSPQAKAIVFCFWILFGVMLAVHFLVKASQ